MKKSQKSFTVEVKKRGARRAGGVEESGLNFPASADRVAGRAAAEPDAWARVFDASPSPGAAAGDADREEGVAGRVLPCLVSEAAVESAHEQELAEAEARLERELRPPAAPSGRRRGRPPKVAPAEVALAEVALARDGEREFAPAHDVAAEAPPRRRGRPPKPVVEGAAADEAPLRRRGRPRRVVVELPPLAERLAALDAALEAAAPAVVFAPATAQPVVTQPVVTLSRKRHSGASEDLPRGARWKRRLPPVLR